MFPPINRISKIRGHRVKVRPWSFKAGWMATFFVAGHRVRYKHCVLLSGTVAFLLITVAVNY